jgi:UDP-N-acetylglucosamine--dolichyl-phosphate N-acetylglucosaminephosphotransferase
MERRLWWRVAFNTRVVPDKKRSNSVLCAVGGNSHRFSGGVLSADLQIGFLVGSFLGTLALAPQFVRRLRERGFVVRDMYKPPGQLVVTHLGLLVLAMAVLALGYTFVVGPPSIVPILTDLQAENPLVVAQVALFAICGYGIFGAVDDRYSLSHFVKGAIPFTLGLPVAILFVDAIRELFVLWQFVLHVETLRIVMLVVIPVYILVVTNLVNMHSGYNGLQSGLALLLLGTILVRAGLEGRLDSNLALLGVIGSIAAIYPFNRYPAKAIEGNVGSFVAGAAIGVGLTTNGYFLAGIIMMIPHIADFLLFVSTKVTGRPFLKFGRLRPDGSIEAPYPFKLKFLLPYYFRLTERQTVRYLYLLSLAFCAASFLVPRG